MGSQLQMNVQPVFLDLADSTLAANQPLTDTAIQAISRNAKFGMVRPETMFSGFYKHADLLPLAISPVDGYLYSLAELMYDFQLFSTRAPGPGFFSGMLGAPPISASQSGSNPFWFTYDVDPTSTLQLNIAYTDSTSVVHDGILKVYSIGQRSQGSL